MNWRLKICYTQVNINKLSENLLTSAEHLLTTTASKTGLQRKEATCSQVRKEAKLQVSTTQLPSQIRKGTIINDTGKRASLRAICPDCEGIGPAWSQKSTLRPCTPIPISTASAYPVEGMNACPTYTKAPGTGTRVGPRICVFCSALPRHLVSVSVLLRKCSGAPRSPRLGFLQR